MNGACVLGSSGPPRGTAAGCAIVKLVQGAPRVAGAVHATGPPTSGRCVRGQNGSMATFGSKRGMHIGNPVTDEIVGLSWSTVKRTSGLKATPYRPVPVLPTAGSLIRMRAPPQTPIG